MPRFYKKMNRRKRRVRKRRKRKFSRNKVNKLMLRGVSVVPDIMIAKLKYVTVQNPTAGATHSRRMALNGLYDPDITGTGHQPLGFDQWMAFYENFICFASKIKMTVRNVSGIEGQIGILPANTGTVATNISLYAESPYGKIKSLGNDQSGKSIATITNYLSMKKYEGFPLASVNYTGSASSNPGITREWHILIQSYDVSSSIDISYNLEIVYYVKFFRRKGLGQS